MEKNRLANSNAEKILNIAWVLFQQKGFRGVSMDELCLQCSVTKPTLYYYFKDKEGLFAQVLVHKLQGLGAVIEEPGRLDERLTRIAAALLDNFQTEYTGLVHDREHISREENRELIRSTFRKEMFDPIIKLMKEAIDNGAFQKDDPQTLTLLFLGMVNNFIGRADEMKQDHQALADKLTQYFLKGVSASGK